ncbi:TolB family protein [Paludisphaera rhizosphaerae]|uniref:TolB family protein n=1 Tax=Paludisphaera rhizosphaerae TaxID=2711216 RepID=UPI001F1067FE|nr:serine/threonine protein kinase [Paludisphaera rhizosphaerae]
MAGSQPFAVTRRAFLGAASLAVALGSRASGDSTLRKPSRFLFTSRGKTGLFDGEKVRDLDFQSPTQQATWQPTGTLRDGRLLLLSMEPRRDGPGRPFGEYYTQTPTHIWAYDLEGGSLQELCTKDRLAPFVTPALVLGEDRLLVQVVRKNVGQIFSVKLDGSDPREFTKAGEGLPYGLSLHPDGRRVAFHLASPAGYQVWTSDLEGGDRRLVAAKEGHLYFGTSWSPDGRHVLYVDCTPGTDPGHDWADVCIGPEHRVLTTGGSMWFAATYGDPNTRGGGSNTPAWTRDGRILFPRRLPDSRVAWEYQAQRPDVDHFNRDYKPDLARGGTEIVRLDPKDGAIASLTHNNPPAWDFRASESPDGESIVFCRAKVGEAPAIWLMGADGTNPRLITRGVDDLGADHPRWF